MVFTCIRLLATCVGYVAIVMWLLGALNVADFVLAFRLG